MAPLAGSATVDWDRKEQKREFKCGGEVKSKYGQATWGLGG
jgi:hypothetical protein